MPLMKDISRHQLLRRKNEGRSIVLNGPVTDRLPPVTCLGSVWIHNRDVSFGVEAIDHFQSIYTVDGY